MKRACDIYNSINEIAPFSTAMDFDNTGILVGDKEQIVSKALICLDVTSAVLQEAENLGVNLIISHHPVIFNAIKKINKLSVVYKIIQKDITVICCHTNLDLCSEYGVNKALARKLGIVKLEKNQGEPWFMGTLPVPMNAAQLAEHIKAALGSKRVDYTSVGGEISQVALCSGSGGEYIYSLESVHALITGEVRHDQWICSVERDLPVFAAGHYETEKPFGAMLKDYLSNQHKDVVFIESAVEENPVNT